MQRHNVIVKKNVAIRWDFIKEDKIMLQKPTYKYKLAGNKKTPPMLGRVLMFGRYLAVAAKIPNKAIIPSFSTTVNSYPQLLSTTVRCTVSIGFNCASTSAKQFIVTVIRGLTPRTGRQSKRNLLDMGYPITALFTVQERAVEPFKKNLLTSYPQGYEHRSK